MACREGLTACYSRAPRLFHDLAMARADWSFVKLMGRRAKSDLLVIDDWGIHPIGDTERRDILEIIEDHNLSTKPAFAGVEAFISSKSFFGIP